MRRNTPWTEPRPTTIAGREARAKTCSRCGGPKDPGRGRSYCDRCRAQREKETFRISRIRRFENDRDYSLYVNHRMRLVDYRKMWLAQGGRCLGCGFAAEVLHVDHDHACCGTRKSCERCRRGLLCGGCNRALGILKDNPATLRALADYVGRWSSSHVS